MSEARYVSAQVDGQEVRLRYGIGGLRAAQAASGKPMIQLFSALLAFDLDAVVVLLRAARVWQQPEITEAEAEALLQRWIDSGSDVDEIAAALLKTAVVSGVLKPDHVDGEGADPNGTRRASKRKTGSAKRTGGAHASASSPTK